MTAEAEKRTVKHTPGPWTATRDPDGICIGGSDPDRPESDEAVALVFTGGKVGRDGRYKANVRLIAAAPELLEALIKAKDALDTASHFIPAESQPSKDLVGNAASRARAAIAKAEGAEQ